MIYDVGFPHQSIGRIANLTTWLKSIAQCKRLHSIPRHSGLPTWADQGCPWRLKRTATIHNNGHEEVHYGTFTKLCKIMYNLLMWITSHLSEKPHLPVSRSLPCPKTSMSVRYYMYISSINELKSTHHIQAVVLRWRLGRRGTSYIYHSKYWIWQQNNQKWIQQNQYI